MKINNLIYLGAGGLAGALICYISLQYTFFEIDLKLNVVETIIAVTGIIVGIIIAVSLRKQVNKQANAYHFIMQHFNELHTNYKTLEQALLNKDKIELSFLTKKYKEIELSRNRLKEIASLSQINLNDLTRMEESFGALNDLIEEQEIKHNIYKLSNVNQEIRVHTTDITKLFIRQFDAINEKLS